MKRTGNLIEPIAERENLELAFWKAARGKQGKREVIAFRANLERELARLHEGILENTVELGRYHIFRIYDPKEREICAAAFSERVLHHAMMNVCDPVFERAAIFDTYACRRGKGRLKAIERAQRFACGSGFFLKMDIRKYFDSIDQSVLIGLLERRFKDAALLALFRRLVTAYEASSGKGVPIGNLTSQYFANDYLGPLDRYLKEALKCRAYVRYMDDFVVWEDSRRRLKAVREAVVTFLQDRLKLQLKDSPMLNRTALGMDFLGFRIFPGRLWLTRSSRRRFLEKYRGYEAAYLRGEWTEHLLQQRVEALFAFARKADTLELRRQMVERFGAVA